MDLINNWKNKLVINLSDVQIPNRIKALLAKGLDFNFQTYLPKSKIAIELEYILNSLDIVNHIEIKNKVQNIVKNHNLSKNHKRSLWTHNNNNNNNKGLKKLIKNNNLVNLQADKSRQSIVMNYQGYIKVAQDLLDNNLYEELSHGPTLKIKKELIVSLKKLLTIKIIDKDDYKFITSYGHRTPKFNIRIKTHKTPIAYRPLVDIKFYCLYNLELFVKSKLKSLVMSKHCIKSTDEFLNNLKEVKMENRFRILSLDIKNMYTSIIQDRIVNSLRSINCADWLIDLVILILLNNHFQFNGKYYIQKSGIPMGSIIGPILAELSVIDIDTSINNTVEPRLSDSIGDWGWSDN
ncbi:uncharacterized protein LOC111641901 [Centruroides sculpturatus]|uniref:uncharacterized protein LOC111641901 n=1 Tax=Centruroides sculpturatus TaxID=218467 RepID=UPI000C6CC9BC|nr:uncharacterized protein LOC111641901 [Centruroides sculpturatus]